MNSNGPGEKTSRMRHMPAFMLAGLAAAALAWTVAGCAEGDDDEGGATVPPTLDDITGQDLPFATETYATALYDAWQQGDQGEIERLANDEATAVLLNRPWAEADAWEFDTCVISNNAFCTWNGAEGMMVFEIDTTQVEHEEEAAIGVTFDEEVASGAVEIPTDPEAYADALFEAWELANYEAIEQLVATDMQGVIVSRPWLPDDGWEKQSCDPTAEGLFCQWESADGETLEIRVDEELAGQGAEQAVTYILFTGF